MKKTERSRRYLLMLLILMLLISMSSCHTKEIATGESGTTGSTTPRATTLPEKTTASAVPTTEPTTQPPLELPNEEISLRDMDLLSPTLDSMQKMLLQELIKDRNASEYDRLNIRPLTLTAGEGSTLESGVFLAAELAADTPTDQRRFPSELYSYTEENAFGFATSKQAFLYRQEEIFPYSSGGSVYVMFSVTSAGRGYYFDQCRQATVQSGVLQLDFAVHVPETPEYTPSSYLVVVKLAASAFEDAFPTSLAMNLTYAERPILAWGDYQPTEQEVFFAERLSDTEEFPRQINLDVRLAFGVGTVDSYDVELIASKGELHAVYLLGIIVEQQLLVDTYGNFVFHYPALNPIRIYREGRLLTMQQAYAEGWLDEEFIKAIYDAPGSDPFKQP